MLRGIVLPIVGEQLRARQLRYFSLNGERSFGQLVAEEVGFKADLDLAHPNNSAAAFTFVNTELLMYHNSQMDPAARFPATLPRAFA